MATEGSGRDFSGDGYSVTVTSFLLYCAMVFQDGIPGGNWLKGTWDLSVLFLETTEHPWLLRTERNPQEPDQQRAAWRKPPQHHAVLPTGFKEGVLPPGGTLSDGREDRGRGRDAPSPGHEQPSTPQPAPALAVCRHPHDEPFICNHVHPHTNL